MGTELSMATPFTEKELGECLELVIDHRGKTPKKQGSDWVDKGIPTISAKNVNGGRLVATDEIRHVTYDVYKRWMKEDVKRGDCFLVSEGATLGECMMWDYDYPIVLGQRIFCLRANPSILYSKYLYAYMTSASFQAEIIGRATGTSVDGLRQTEVLKLKLRLPPLIQQKYVGDLLYNLNKKIEFNRRMNSTLESMARALFQSWFVDFDPVRAKLDGRQPEGMDAKTAALFPDTFRESELGHIPTGWAIHALKDVIEVKHGFAFEGKYFCDEAKGDILLTPGNFDIGGGFKANKLKYYDGPVPTEYVLNDHDLVVTMTDLSKAADTLGYPAMVPPPPAGFRFLHNQRLGRVIVSRPEIAAPQFLYRLLSSSPYRQEILAGATGTTVKHTSPSRITAFRGIFPTPDVMRLFEGQVSSWYRRLTQNNEESRTLATLRDSLLPKLLSGELNPDVLAKD